MNSEDDISVSRTLISMPEEFTLQMKNYAKENDIKFSELIRDALRLYTSSGDDCFVVLARQHAGSEAADLAAKVFADNKITQSHFLGHIIREAAESLHDLDDPKRRWKEIKCKVDVDIDGDDDEPDEAIVIKTEAWKELLQKIHRRLDEVQEQLEFQNRADSKKEEDVS